MNQETHEGGGSDFNRADLANWNARYGTHLRIVTPAHTIFHQLFRMACGGADLIVIRTSFTVARHASIEQFAAALHSEAAFEAAPLPPPEIMGEPVCFV